MLTLKQFTKYSQISQSNLRVCLQRPQYSSKTVKGNTNNLITQFLEQGTSSKDAISGRLNQLGNAFLKCATTVHLITTSEMQKGSLIDLQILRDEKLQQLGKSDGSEKQCKSYHVPHDALKRFRRLKVPSKYWTLAMFDDLGKIMDDEIRMLVAWRESIAAGSTEQRINDYLVLTAAHFVERGYRSALLFLSWLGQRVLPVKIIRKKSTSDSVLGMNGCYELIYGHWQRPEFVSRSIRKQSLEKAHDLSLGSAGIEDEIAYQFKDQFLLLQTVTHRSFAANTITPANEQLIFLGDALLSFLLAKCLFHHPSQFDLERNAFIKNVLESRANGANAIVRCDLQKFLLYSEDDMRQQMDLYVEQRRDQYFDIQIDIPEFDDKCEKTNLDVTKELNGFFNAIVGAVFIDSNFSLDATWRVITRIIGHDIDLLFLDHSLFDMRRTPTRLLAASAFNDRQPGISRRLESCV